MSQALAVRRDDVTMSFADVRQVSAAFAKSGFFTDATDEAKAIVKVMAGQELGFGPFASMSGLYIVKGKVSISANLMAARIKASTKYDFKVAKGHPTDTECAITFYENVNGQWIELGESKFTAADAKKAGTQNMDKFAKNMLFARAISNGCKFYCPDVFSTPVYTPEEMGAIVDGEGNVIDAPSEPSLNAERDSIIEKLKAIFLGNNKTGGQWTEYFEKELADLSTEKLASRLAAWEKAAAERAAQAAQPSENDVLIERIEAEFKTLDELGISKSEQDALVMRVTKGETLDSCDEETLKAVIKVLSAATAEAAEGAAA